MTQWLRLYKCGLKLIQILHEKVEILINEILCNSPENNCAASATATTYRFENHTFDIIAASAGDQCVMTCNRGYNGLVPCAIWCIRPKRTLNSILVKYRSFVAYFEGILKYGLTRHAFAWQIALFWQDTLDLSVFQSFHYHWRFNKWQISYRQTRFHAIWA